MRRESFTMERDILEIGDKVTVTEGRLPYAYYYMAEPAAAMSANIPLTARLKSTEGTVVTKERDGASWEILIEFNE